MSPSRNGKIVIVVDTRAKEPYGFDSERVTVVRCTLPTVDDSLDGRETVTAAERQSLDDYIASVVSARERFGRELQILAGYAVACVVVEATLEDILSHRYCSGTYPSAVLGATLPVIVEHGVPVFFCGNRQIACRFVEGLLRRYHRRGHVPDETVVTLGGTMDGSEKEQVERRKMLLSVPDLTRTGTRRPMP